MSAVRHAFLMIAAVAAMAMAFAARPTHATVLGCPPNCGPPPPPPPPYPQYLLAPTSPTLSPTTPNNPNGAVFNVNDATPGFSIGFDVNDVSEIIFNLSIQEYVNFYVASPDHFFVQEYIPDSTAPTEYLTGSVPISGYMALPIGPADFFITLLDDPPGVDGIVQILDTVPTDPPVPGPIAGAGIPGLVAACAGLLAWWRRRKKKV